MSPAEDYIFAFPWQHTTDFFSLSFVYSQTTLPRSGYKNHLGPLESRTIFREVTLTQETCAGLVRLGKMHDSIEAMPASCGLSDEQKTEILKMFGDVAPWAYSGNMFFGYRH